MPKLKLVNGDCLAVLKRIPSNSIDSIVTDPPYAFEGGFMGQAWDNFKTPQEFMQFTRSWATECFRVIKPGGHIVSFCSTKMYPWMAVGIELAGFRPRDMISWIYSSGFPKSYDVAQAIEKFQTTGVSRRPDRDLGGKRRHNLSQNVGQETGGKIPLTTPDAIAWEGWGTALKPAQEPIMIAQKPLSEKNNAQNVLKHRTGGINVDGCRVGDRHPANVVHDGSPAVMEAFAKYDKPKNVDSIAEFFYCMKANSKERTMNRVVDNDHPTVKPLTLMRYLVRLVTPKNGIVLDPFLGSGTTAIACLFENFNCFGIEKEQRFHALSLARVNAAVKSNLELQRHTSLLLESNNVRQYRKNVHHNNVGPAGPDRVSGERLRPQLLQRVERPGVQSELLQRQRLRPMAGRSSAGNEGWLPPVHRRIDSVLPRNSVPRRPVSSVLPNNRR